MDTKLSTYAWSGIKKDGKRADGVLQAADAKSAHADLNKMGIEVISLQPKQQTSIKIKMFSKSGEKKIKPKDILLFTRYMSTMLAAGLPIIQALDIIAGDQENPAMKNMILTIKTNIESGKTLAESFSHYPKQFSELYCSLIKAGEKSGSLDKTLIRLGMYLERTEQLKRKVKKALVYPTAIMSVAILISLILLIFVVPQFQKLFSTFGAELPLFTRIVVNMSDFLRAYWWLVAGVIGVSVWQIRHLLQTSEKLKEFIDRNIIKLTLIGPVLKYGIIARFTRTLSTTLESGMPITESMRSMAAVMGNRVYTKAVLQICDDVVNGNQLSTSMRSTNLFPNMAVQMVAVGEAAGTLSTMLGKVADYYEEEVNAIVDNLSSLMEPLIMLVLGVVVGSFVVAMYLPIFKLGSLF